MSEPQQYINVGQVANDGTGESLRDAFNAVNNNFANVWAAGPVNSQVVISYNRVSTNETNLDLILAGNGIGNVTVASTTVPSIDAVYDLGRANRRWDEIHAVYYYGNGAYLTGITGNGGGGPNVYFSQGAPGNASIGDIWIESDTGVQYIYFNDDTSNQWAEMEAYQSFSSGGNGTANTGNWAFSGNNFYNLNGGNITNGDLTHGYTAGINIPTNGDANAILLNNTYGNIILQAGANSDPTATWIFGNDGNLTIPGNATIQPLGDDLTIDASTGNVYVKSKGHTFLFDANGVGRFVMPDNGKIAADSNLSINVGDWANSAGSLWTFHADGNTTLPGNSTITTSEGAFLTTRTFSGNAYTQQNQDTNTWEIYPEDDVTGPNSAWAWIKASLYTADTPEVFIENQKGSDGVPHRWTFDANGNLTLPANTFAVNYANGDPVSLGGGATNLIANGNSYANIATADGNLVVNVGTDGYGTWTFETGTGNLIGPGNASQGAGIVFSTEQSVYIREDMGQLNIDAFHTVITSNSGNIGNIQSWNFDNDGNLTVPGNIIGNNLGNPMYITGATANVDGLAGSLVLSGGSTINGFSGIPSAGGTLELNGGNATGCATVGGSVLINAGQGDGGWGDITLTVNSKSTVFNYAGQAILPAVKIGTENSYDPGNPYEGEQLGLYGTRRIISPNSGGTNQVTVSTIIQSPQFGSPQVVYTAYNANVWAFKMTMRIQHGAGTSPTPQNMQMADIFAARNDSGDITYSITNRLKTDPTEDDVVIVPAYDPIYGTMFINATATGNGTASNGSYYFTFDVVEFNQTYD